MAFKDLSVVLYKGQYKLDYKDKSHTYYVRPRINFELPESHKDAWGKIIRPKGTTTLIGDTLEKKALMLWPMGVALADLFGFYNFTNEKGEKMTGFSKGKGTLWDANQAHLVAHTKDQTLPLVLNASKVWQQRQKKGADIGSIVHDAIEHYVLENSNNPDIEPTGNVFDIAEQYMWNIKEAQYETEADRERALQDFAIDTEMAKTAFLQFQIWWTEHQPKLSGAEDLIYSKQHNISGTFDALIELDGKRVLCDWKTSNASKNEAVAMPEGISYQYFLQSAIYAMAWEEMHKFDLESDDILIWEREHRIDDLMIVSCRKDGGFTTIKLSDLGITMEEMYDYARSVINSYKMAEKLKAGLMAHAKGDKDGNTEN